MGQRRHEPWERRIVTDLQVVGIAVVAWIIVQMWFSIHIDRRVGAIEKRLSEKDSGGHP